MRPVAPKPTPGLRRALALIDLAAQAAGHAEHCDPAKVAGRPTVIVGVDEQTLHDDYGAAELEGGTVIPGKVAQRLACDAHIIFASMKDGEILDLGRKTRTPSAALRRYLIARDGGCVFEGCQTPAGACEAHHIIFWTSGGPTDRANLILLCLYHHHLVHDDGWQVIGNARSPGLHFRSPDGHTKIPATRRPVKPRAPSMLKL